MGTTRLTYAFTRWFFLRLLGLIYLIAFVSLWTQISGLVGSHGILPAGPWLDALRAHLGRERYWLLPTACWWNASDAFLHLLCGAGTLASLLLIVDVAPVSMLACAWLAYLSLTNACQAFLSFQWDALLLETGFLAIFVAPLHLMPRRRPTSSPSTAIAWLFRWLLFRLMFSSGLVKLLSGDPTWSSLTALRFHYETQPLPPWTAWHMHQLPAWFHTASVLVMFLNELALPFLIFLPRRCRLVACAGFIGFQLLIVATGNYCFFNWLTIALCLWLVDDDVWPARWRAVLTAHAHHHRARPSREWPRAVATIVAGWLLLCSAAPLLGFFRRTGAPPLVAKLYGWIEPWRLVNSYGLFAVMTTQRHEIIVEGSDDGQTWQAYAFTDKPGDLRQRPRFVAPHQPRLDWQMWFAALGSYRDNPWFLNFCGRLLEGSPPVLKLLAANPFPTHPPRYIRAVVYDYHFTDRATRRREGAWWRRERLGDYCPALSLREQ